MTFNEFLNTCPKNNNFYLLENLPSNISMAKPKKNRVSQNITNVSLLVFNKETEMTSRKSIYVNSKFEFYFKDSGGYKKSQMLFLKDFSK